MSSFRKRWPERFGCCDDVEWRKEEVDSVAVVWVTGSGCWATAGSVVDVRSGTSWGVGAVWTLNNSSKSE